MSSAPNVAFSPALPFCLGQALLPSPCPPVAKAQHPTSEAEDGLGFMVLLSTPTSLFTTALGVSALDSMHGVRFMWAQIWAGILSCQVPAG